MAYLGYVCPGFEQVELGQEGVSKSYNTDSSVVDTYNGILPFYVKAISPFPYMKYCELEGDSTIYSIMLFPLWSISALYRGTRETVRSN